VLKVQPITQAPPGQPRHTHLTVHVCL
jgi:hypothetical protein